LLSRKLVRLFVFLLRLSTGQQFWVYTLFSLPLCALFIRPPQDCDWVICPFRVKECLLEFASCRVLTIAEHETHKRSESVSVSTKSMSTVAWLCFSFTLAHGCKSSSLVTLKHWNSTPQNSS
jgi:hypothetical protein